VQWKNTRLLIDPYLSDSLTKKYAQTDKPHVRMTRRVIAPERLTRISIVTASHQHTDHLDAQTLQAIRTADAAEATPWNPLFVAPRAIKELAEERWGGAADVLLSDHESHGWGDVSIHAVTAAHDRIERNERGWSVYLGYVFRLGPHVIYHSGDSVVYDGMVEMLRPFNIDVALLPINGMLGNMNGGDAAGLAKAIDAKLVVPCHYDMFEFNTADPRDQFIPECDRLGKPCRILRGGERLSIETSKR
jgi:L-ascorbate metabolism protein UlaG (beta-lactamase superfamily)